MRELVEKVNLEDPEPDFRLLFSFDTFKDMVLEMAKM